MGREQASPSGLYGAGDRGAGGKFKKPATRKAPATPYDRPPANQSLSPAQRRDGGWLSRLVDPACRLIADGATRILPSFFSKSPFTAASTAEDHDNDGTEVKENTYGENEGCNLNLGISESSGEKNPRKEEDNLNGSSDFDQLGHVKRSYLPDGMEFSKIEQLVKGRSFSSADIDRLTEILNSRVTDLCNVEPEEKKPNMASKREGDDAALAHENSRTYGEKYEALNRATPETSMPLLQSVVKEEVGASPVDIARAYMGIRVSEVGTDFKRIISKDERALLQKDRFTSKPLFSSPSPRSSVCWPGAIVQDQYGGSTPQNASSRYGLHSFPRSPYSRTIYSKSKSKLTHLQADKNRYLNIPSSTHWQPQTPLYGQSKGEILYDGNGSVGPIRHLRHKFLSEAPPRASVSCHFPQNVPSQAGNSKDSKGFLPSIKKNSEAGATITTTDFHSVDNMINSSEVGIPTLQTPNSAVRAILDHLDRNKPTLKEKSAELKLATLWKKSSSSEADNAMLNDRTSLPHLEDSNFTKSSNFVDKKSFAQGNNRGNKIFELIPQASTREVTDAVNKDTETSSSANGCRDSRKFMHEMASFRFPDSRQKPMNALQSVHNQINEQCIVHMVPNSAANESLKKPPFYPSGTKPILSSISVDKPDPRQTVFSDNSFGFTFPVSTSSVLSEPPTPSVMPSTSPGGLPQPMVGPAIPSYSFGTTRSTPALVFSFPSMSTDSLQDDMSDLKFSFRSDEKNRISFRSVGKDAICF